MKHTEFRISIALTVGEEEVIWEEHTEDNFGNILDLWVRSSDIPQAVEYLCILTFIFQNLN